MKVTWVGVAGLALLMSTVFAGTGLYLFKDRLTLSPVVVTTASIPGCSPIQPSMMKVIRLPHMGIPPGTARTLSDVKNRWTSCGYAIPKNSFVYLSHVVSPGSSVAGLLHNQGTDTRLITIPADLSASIGNRLKAGDHVDIWFASKPQKPSGMFVGKLFDDIDVVSLTDAKGNEMESDNMASASAKKGVLSFAVTPSLPSQMYLTIRIQEEDIPYVLTAREEGQLLPVGRGTEPAANSTVSEDAKTWLHQKMEENAP